MDPICFYRQASKISGTLVSSGFFLLGCVWLIMGNKADSESATIGWLAAIFFGMVFLIALFMVFDRRPQLIISESGIRSRANKGAELKWEEINQASSWNIFGQKYVSLKLKPGCVMSQERPFRLSLGPRPVQGSVDLVLNDLKLSPSALVSFIEEMKVSPAVYRRELIRRYFGTTI